MTMGLFDRFRNVVAPAPSSETVVDAVPPADPNALGVGGRSQRGPSVFFNPLQGIGTRGDSSWWDNWRYPRQLTEEQREAFNRDALIQRALSLKSDDATREGWSVDIDTRGLDEGIDADTLAEAIKDYENREQIAMQATIADALYRADLHRYAIVWLGVQDGTGEGGSTDPAQPVDLDSIETISWARVFDSRDVDIVGIHNIDSDEFGAPTAYAITDIQGVLPEGWRTDKSVSMNRSGGIRNPLSMPEVNGSPVAEIVVHASRCMLFMSPDAISVPDSTQWHFANYFRAQHAVSRGATQFSQTVIKVKDWLWKARNRDQQASLDRVTLLQQMRSLYNAIILDKDEEDFSQISGAVSGLDKMVNPAMVDLAATLGVSVTRLFGVSPGGFGKGESERENDEATARMTQTNRVKPQLRKAHTYIVLADDFTGPQVDIKPESREIVFEDLSPPDESEEQTILSQRVADVIAAASSTPPLLGIDEARKSLEALNTQAFSFKIELPPELPPVDPNAAPLEQSAGVDPLASPEAIDGEAPGDTEDVEAPDELEVAFSNDPLPNDAGTAKDIAAKLTKQLGRKIPTGRITRLARPGPEGEPPKIRSWDVLGGAHLHSLREVMMIIARANKLVPEPEPEPEPENVDKP